MISAILVALVIFSAIQLGGQGVVFGLVHLNFVATWEELPIGNVPYYRTSNTFAQAVERYSLDWWLLLFDFFDFFIPGIIFMAYLMALRGSKSFLWVLWLYLLFCGVLNLGRFSYRLIGQFPFCNTFGNICRSTNPAKTASAFDTDNLLWMTLFTYNGVFLFWLVIYAVLASKIGEQVEYDRQDINKKFLKSKNIPIQAIDLLLTNTRVAIFIVDKTGMPYQEQVSGIFNLGKGEGAGKVVNGPHFPSPPQYTDVHQPFNPDFNNNNYSKSIPPEYEPPSYYPVGQKINALSPSDLIKNNGSGNFLVLPKQNGFVKNSVNGIINSGKSITSNIMNGGYNLVKKNE